MYFTHNHYYIYIVDQERIMLRKKSINWQIIGYLILKSVWSHQTRRQRSEYFTKNLSFFSNDLLRNFAVPEGLISVLWPSFQPRCLYDKDTESYQGQ